MIRKSSLVCTINHSIHASVSILKHINVLYLQCDSSQANFSTSYVHFLVIQFPSSFLVIQFPSCYKKYTRVGTNYMEVFCAM